MALEFWVARSSFRFRTETPSHCSWSPDDSIIAVSLGPYVALFDPLTTSLLHLFMSRKNSHVVSARFVGQQGRYVVVVGITSIVLWDLVNGIGVYVILLFVTNLSRSSERHCNVGERKIQHVLCHPLEDSFVVFYDPIEDPAQSILTRIELFRCSSESPYATYKIPFKLINLAWYSLGSRIAEPSIFTVVGMSSSWDVILLGDRTEALEISGSMPRGNVAGLALQQRRSIFQDIFGKSAFAGALDALPLSTPMDSTKARTSNIASIFDGPAYLMPPLESLFEPVVKSLLRPRDEDVDSHVVDDGENGVTGELASDDDVDMDHDE